MKMLDGESDFMAGIEPKNEEEAFMGGPAEKSALHAEVQQTSTSAPAEVPDDVFTDAKFPEFLKRPLSDEVLELCVPFTVLHIEQRKMAVCQVLCKTAESG